MAHFLRNHRPVGISHATRKDLLMEKAEKQAQAQSHVQTQAQSQEWMEKLDYELNQTERQFFEEDVGKEAIVAVEKRIILQIIENYSLSTEEVVLHLTKTGRLGCIAFLLKEVDLSLVWNISQNPERMDAVRFLKYVYGNGITPNEVDPNEVLSVLTQNVFATSTTLTDMHRNIRLWHSLCDDPRFSADQAVKLLFETVKESTSDTTYTTPEEDDFFLVFPMLCGRCKDMAIINPIAMYGLKKTYSLYDVKELYHAHIVSKNDLNAVRDYVIEKHFDGDTENFEKAWGIYFNF